MELDDIITKKTLQLPIMYLNFLASVKSRLEVTGTKPCPATDLYTTF